MSEKEEFEYSEKMVLDEAAGYLSLIADGFRSRLLKLQGKGQMITLTPEDAVKVEVKAERKGNKGKLGLEISWKEKYATSEEKLTVTSCAQLEQEATPEPEAAPVRKSKSKEQPEDTV